MLTRAVLVLTGIAWILCLAFFSLRRFGPHRAPGSMGHRADHVIAFAILALVLLPLARNRAQIWIVVISILCLAAGLELRQRQIFSIPFEWWDVRDDCIGVILALLLVRFTPLKRICRSSSGNGTHGHNIRAVTDISR
jgi:hypothetical protein